MIYFIGAGPGAVDLITVKGKSLLEKADLIIYAGSLVNHELLKYAKTDCVIMNSAHMTLEEVITAMVPAAQSGKLVVRLHTGDPSIYGAHREQIDLLRGYGLEYEVVPGVSSFCAAAAALKAEYTLPNISQSVSLLIFWATDDLKCGIRSQEMVERTIEPVFVQSCELLTVANPFVADRTVCFFDF